jgi:DNA-binding transcriptional LysR family regulator
MQHSHLRALEAVIETGSFTRAAERLCLTQPAVSHAIAGLERELGGPLVTRHRVNVTPTDLGARVLSHARVALRALERIEQEVSAIQGLQQGVLRVGSFASASANVLPGVMALFSQRHPRVELSLLEGTDREASQALEEGQVDVAFVVIPTHQGDAIPLAHDEMRAVLPAWHPLAEQRSVKLEQLQDERLIVARGGCATIVDELFRTHGLSKQATFTIGEAAVTLALVEKGLGVTIMPELVLPAQPPGVAVRPLQPTARRQLAIAVPALHVSPAAKAFAEVAVEWRDQQAETVPNAQHDGHPEMARHPG